MARGVYRHADLAPLLSPRSIAVIGASPRPGAFGERTLRNLSGFRGRLYAVNPKYDRILDTDCYQSARSLPERVDVAVQARDLDSFLAYARAHPDGSYSSVGIGSMGHLCMEELKRVTGIRLTHVPYRGGAPAVTDLLAGVVPIMFSDMQSAFSAIRGGSVRAIAVGSRSRSRFLPAVPTIAEQGIAGIEAVAFGGLVGRAGIAPEAVSRIAAALRDVIADAQVSARILETGAEPAPTDGQTFKDRLNRALEEWGPVIEHSGVRGSAQ